MSQQALIHDLYAGSYRRLVLQLYPLIGDLAEAQDVVQEAFVRLLANPRRAAALDNPEAWLRTVAINLARSRWRRERCRNGCCAGSRPTRPRSPAPRRTTSH